MKTLHLIFILMLFLSSFAWSQSLTKFSYEGRIQGPVITTGVMPNETFSVSIRRPDGCGGNLATGVWSSSTITINDGYFSLSPSFAADLLAQSMDPWNQFGAACTIPEHRRNLVINYGSENFTVSLGDAPKATFSSYSMYAKNADAIGGVAVQSPLSCSSNQILKYNTGMSRLECQPLAVADIPALSAAQVNSGTFAVAQMPAPAGDVTGSFGAMSVDRIRGVSVSPTAPSAGQVLTYSGGTWIPQTPAAGAETDPTVQTWAKAAPSADFTVGASLGLSNTGVTAGSYGSSSNAVQISVDSRGRVTSLSQVAVNDTTKLPLAGGTMTGAINMGTQNITNATTISATNLSGTNTTTRNLNLNDNDTNYAIIRTPSNLAADYTLQLPVDDGVGGQVLTTDGAGILSWTTPSGGGFTNGGNTFGSPAALGTNDNFSFNFETNNSARMTIDNIGNVGIGTTIPTTNLHIAGPVNTEIKIQSSGAGNHANLNLTAGVGGRAFIYSGTPNSSIYLQDSGGGYIMQADTTNHGISIGSGVGYAQTANSSPPNGLAVQGNVGIGTTTPSERLDVNGGVNFRGLFSAPSMSVASEGKIYFDSTLGRFRVSEDGNSWRDLSSTDVVTNGTYYTDISSAGCTDFETPYWSTMMDQWLCQPINSTSAGGFIRESGNNFPFDMTIGTNLPQALNFETNGATRMTILNDGKVGIGTTPLSPFHTQTTLTSPSGTLSNGQFITFASPSAAHTGSYSSLTSELNISSGAATVSQAYSANIRSFTTAAIGVSENSSLNVLNQKTGSGVTSNGRGIASSLQASSGVITNAIGVASEVRTNSGGTMGDVRSVYATVLNNSGGSMTDATALTGSVTNNSAGTNSATGLEVSVSGASAPMNAYGIKIGPVTGSLNSYALYQNDPAAKNFFGGLVGINQANPVANLDVNGTFRLGNGGTILTKVIICQGVTFTNGTAIASGTSQILTSSIGTCPGIVSGMQISCSLDSESVSTAVYTPYTANATDQTNNQIRMKASNISATSINSATLTAVFTCKGTRN